jgi:hypothetical protein
MVQSFWRLRHPGWTVRSPDWVRKFFCPPKRPDRLWTNSAYYSVSTGVVYSLGVRLPRRVIEHSRSSRTEVKNEWSYTSAPPIHLQNVHSDNYTFKKVGTSFGFLQEKKSTTYYYVHYLLVSTLV